jgi:hypothetical protein
MEEHGANSRHANATFCIAGRTLAANPPNRQKLLPYFEIEFEPTAASLEAFMLA